LRNRSSSGVKETVTDLGRAFALVVCLAATATPAQAYVQSVGKKGALSHWTNPDQHLLAYVGEPRGPLGSPELLNAVTAAAAAWSYPQVACTSAAVKVDGVAEATAPIGLDGVNRLIFRRDRWCSDSPEVPCHGRQILAVTTNTVGLHSGEILETDIEVNAVNYTWADLVAHPELTGVYDLQNALTHELGHFLGFTHSCRVSSEEPLLQDDRGQPVRWCGEEDQIAHESTMVATISERDLERRSPSADDQRGVCNLYPAGIAQGVTIVAGGGGGCAVAPPGRGGWWWLALLAALSIRRRTRRS
jgi:MYXO-CTERM domain-containing protein